MELETKNFKLIDITKVKKAIDDELGLDFDTNIDENNKYFTLTIFDIESRKEISIVADIEDRFDALDDIEI